MGSCILTSTVAFRNINTAPSSNINLGCASAVIASLQLHPPLPGCQARPSQGQTNRPAHRQQGWGPAPSTQLHLSLLSHAQGCQLGRTCLLPLTLEGSAHGWESNPAAVQTWGSALCSLRELRHTQAQPGSLSSLLTRPCWNKGPGSQLAMFTRLPLPHRTAHFPLPLNQRSCQAYCCRPSHQTRGAVASPGEEGAQWVPGCGCMRGMPAASRPPEGKLR